LFFNLAAALTAAIPTVIHTTKIKKRNRDFQKKFGKSLKKVWKYENNPLTFEP